jgi:hypothetical protein
MSAENWKTTFEVIGVLLLLLTFLAGAGALYFSNRVNAIKDRELRNFDSELTDAKRELGTQQERTARAQKDASDAALALAKFKAPRDLTPEQQDKLILVLKPFAGQHYSCAAFPDPESLALLRLLDTLAKSSGWRRVQSQIERPSGILMEVAGETAASIFDSGVTAYVAPEDKDSVPAQMALCSALSTDGIQCETHQTPQLAGKHPRAITIAVGKTP